MSRTGPCSSELGLRGVQRVGRGPEQRGQSLRPKARSGAMRSRTIRVCSGEKFLSSFTSGFTRRRPLRRAPAPPRGLRGTQPRLHRPGVGVAVILVGPWRHLPRHGVPRKVVERPGGGTGDTLRHPRRVGSRRRRCLRMGLRRPPRHRFPRDSIAQGHTVARGASRPTASLPPGYWR